MTRIKKRKSFTCMNASDYGNKTPYDAAKGDEDFYISQLCVFLLLILYVRNLLYETKSENRVFLGNT